MEQKLLFNIVQFLFTHLTFCLSVSLPDPLAIHSFSFKTLTIVMFCSLNTSVQWYSLHLRRIVKSLKLWKLENRRVDSKGIPKDDVVWFLSSSFVILILIILVNYFLLLMELTDLYCIDIMICTLYE